MRSEVFLRDNLIALLTAIATAHSDLAQRVDDPWAEVYSAGFHAALRAVAAALNIDFQPDTISNRTTCLDSFGDASNSSLDSAVIRIRPQRRLPAGLRRPAQSQPADS